MRARRRRAQQRARAIAVLVFVGILLVLTLVFTAFGPGGDATRATPTTTSGTIGASSRPSAAVVLGSVGNLLIRLPVADAQVTAIGFHGSRDGAVELKPAGRQANEGLLLRLWHSIAGAPETGPVWYQLDSPLGPATHVLDVGAFPGTDVYSPVNGTIAAITDFVLDGSKIGSRIDIRPVDAPSVTVSLTHLRADAALAVGSTVNASSSKIGTIVDVAAAERQALGRHAGAQGNNVAITVYPAAATLP